MGRDRRLLIYIINGAGGAQRLAQPALHTQLRIDLIPGSVIVDSLHWAGQFTGMAATA